MAQNRPNAKNFCITHSFRAQHSIEWFGLPVNVNPLCVMNNITYCASFSIVKIISAESEVILRKKLHAFLSTLTQYHSSSEIIEN